MLNLLNALLRRRNVEEEDLGMTIFDNQNDALMRTATFVAPNFDNRRVLQRSGLPAVINRYREVHLVVNQFTALR